MPRSQLGSFFFVNPDRDLGRAERANLFLLQRPLKVVSIPGRGQRELEVCSISALLLHINALTGDSF